MNITPRDPEKRKDYKANALKRGERLRWRCEFMAGKDPKTQKPRRVYEEFEGTAGQARDFWHTRQAQIDGKGAGFTKPDRQPLADYLRKWLDKFDGKPTTLASYRTLVEKHIIPAIGAVPLCDLTPPLVSDWQAEMLQKMVVRKKARGDQPAVETRISPKRVANARMVLHTALGEAVKHFILPTNPVSPVDAPKQAPKIIRAYGRDQVQALTKAAQGHRLEALFLVAWQTGLRMGELLALRWEDLDPHAATVRIARSAATTGGAVFMQDPKTEAGIRVLVLPTQTVAALKAHKGVQAAERLKAGAAWADYGLVFPTKKGTAIQPAAMERTWHSVRKQAGLPEFGMHVLRHTFASLALSEGMPLEMVSEMLGHTNVSFTKRVYAEFLLHAKQKAADTMGAAIRRVTGG